MVADFHSHILPGIDDGSASIEESMKMLREESRQGISCVVATPHFYGHQDSPRRFVARRQEAFERLTEAMQGQPDLPEVRLGAEVYYFHGISECEELELLTLRGTRCVLVEMPMAKWTDSMYRDLVGIREKQGLIPVIAHVDRYIAPLRTHGIPDRLAKLPVLVQANASFFIQRSTRSMALRMLKNDRIHLLGSDCHNMDSRPPRMDKALQIIRQSLGDEALEAISQTQNMLFR